MESAGGCIEVALPSRSSGNGIPPLLRTSPPYATYFLPFKPTIQSAGVHYEGSKRSIFAAYISQHVSKHDLNTGEFCLAPGTVLSKSSF